MGDNLGSETGMRILDAAEELFSKRGYAAVRLRDIAGRVGMRHASLYYYVPGGKEELFIAVMERSFRRHREGMARAIGEAGGDIRDQVHAVGQWLVSQPPLNLSRMHQADMPAIAPEQAERLMQVAFDSVRLPLVGALEAARDAGQVDTPDLDMAAMALVSLVQAVQLIPEQYRTADVQQKVARQFADMLLQGLLAR